MSNSPFLLLEGIMERRIPHTDILINTEDFSLTTNPTSSSILISDRFVVTKARNGGTVFTQNLEGYYNFIREVSFNKISSTDLTVETIYGKLDEGEGINPSYLNLVPDYIYFDNDASETGGVVQNYITHDSFTYEEEDDEEDQINTGAENNLKLVSNVSSTNRKAFIELSNSHTITTSTIDQSVTDVQDTSIVLSNKSEQVGSKYSELKIENKIDSVNPSNTISIFTKQVGVLDDTNICGISITDSQIAQDITFKVDNCTVSYRKTTSTPEIIPFQADVNIGSTSNPFNDLYVNKIQSNSITGLHSTLYNSAYEVGSLLYVLVVIIRYDTTGQNGGLLYRGTHFKLGDAVNTSPQMEIYSIGFGGEQIVGQNDPKKYWEFVLLEDGAFSFLVGETQSYVHSYFDQNMNEQQGLINRKLLAMRVK